MERPRSTFHAAQRQKQRRERLGITARKMLMLLTAGITLGFTGTPSRYGRILKTAHKEWKRINRKELSRTIRKLYESRLIHYASHKDGSTEIVLTKEGREVVLRYKLNELRIPAPATWDKKWRVIIFDVPEHLKHMRDSLRKQLQKLGCFTLQRSVFVHPYECRNEIDFVIELLGARRYVRFIEATSIDNELHLKKRFRLL